MQSVKIICVGKLKDKFFRDASDEYMKRLKGYCKAEIIEIPAANLPDDPNDALIAAALEKEADAILKKIPSNSTVVAMCVEGKLYSSEDVAELLSKSAMNSGEIVFIIGGSYGLHENVKKRADVRMSASKMTFPHRLFRVMLLEQIYRGYKINSGGKYHK
ncbi:MAG: 23S rRNA (pseudouridine(1915)-N(3))-methyltransferase RlmH [Clostridia bacterium]|nr:23S rRNA (pseudouridine(1915)-N(3))-methyltransferase RlmH [Clostridia bacterium]